ncbi:MAG TPA: hypothetical protein EYQ83_13020 [Acidobacteria bacterium]|nr:hypothetical protein [Acidobacteriota bacterium]
MRDVMGLEDTVQQQGEQLLQRIRDLSEPEIRAFVSDMLTSAAKERAGVLDETRRLAEDEQGRAVRDESARVRDEVEQAWAAKFREASAAAEERLATASAAAEERRVAELRDAQKLAHRQLSEKVTNVRAEGQRVLEAAVEAVGQEAGRTLAIRLERQREEAERTLVAELEGAAVAAAAETELAVTEATAVAAAVPLPPPTDDVVIRVRDGIRRLGRVSRLTDALDALGELAGHEASRAAVLIVEGDRVRGWRFTAFEPAVAPAHEVDLKLAEAGLVGHAVVTGATHSWVSDADTASGDGAPAFTALPVGARALAVPVVVGGQVMAVLYGDDAGREPAAAWRASLEILASHAGQCMESLTAARTAQLVSHEMPAVVVDDHDPGPTLPFGEGDDDGVGTVPS